ncbi:MAG: thiamine pyrophosphate-dependent enzyme [Crocinitomicaceae bacterium]|jgi:pyruvate/2-oxoglutarate/acetoin dehydrogenase E1 component/TPP-dependent pyruvate/acetoin dehydrogenase alpha subunit|tara:strand:+ start:26324 stop:28774 length:2451 start_codon:yes stop_codon:yes gene_type:complete
MEGISKKEKKQNENVDFEAFKTQVIEDYKLVCLSREASLLGRKEVLTGKAKFGIFGDGKELAQIALAKEFRKGDFRAGYYRDQTIMLAINELTIEQYFSGLYAHADVEVEPQSAGRQMGGHYATRSLDHKGHWKNLMQQKNSSSDISPTAGQMPRLVGLAQASKVYRENKELSATESAKKFTNYGNEVAFGTIGDASTSEGPFWESINAAGVMQIPLVMSVWDDGYGISVPRDLQTTKGSISEALAGMQRTADKKGYEIFVTKGWDYAHLCQTYEKAVRLAREEHVPVLIHVKEVNQPQGHSTSGSHERYKSKERLAWEKEYDCIEKFKEWILAFNVSGNKIADENVLDGIHKEAKAQVRDSKNNSWKKYTSEIQQELKEVSALIEATAQNSSEKQFILKELENLNKTYEPIRKDLLNSARKVIRMMFKEKTPQKSNLGAWVKKTINTCYDKYSSHLYSESDSSIHQIKTVPPTYGKENRMEDGRIILRENFNAQLAKIPELLIFGEDAGKIGGVNQSLEGLQEQYGINRVFDTGIRECTIIGQGIGMAMRGLRPIAEIQYLDYLLYAVQVLSDDLSTLQYRTKGGQKAPLIVSTRGHRLEGIWHSGSPMGMIINALRGMLICVPRNMTKAAGFYNTLLQADEPALVIEPLNGYRTKEKYPENIGEFTEALGIPEIVQEGTDITLVSYGSTFNICELAAKQLSQFGISVELVDIQTLIPFDIHHKISESLKKTNRLLIIDEDVSSGATGYMLDKIMVEQECFYHLDSAPHTMSSKDHRSAYGSDGDYFSKPNIDDIIEKCYAIMSEVAPSRFPPLY